MNGIGCHALLSEITRLTNIHSLQNGRDRLPCAGVRSDGRGLTTCRSPRQPGTPVSTKEPRLESPKSESDRENESPGRWLSTVTDFHSLCSGRRPSYRKQDGQAGRSPAEVDAAETYVNVARQTDRRFVTWLTPAAAAAAAATSGSWTVTG